MIKDKLEEMVLAWGTSKSTGEVGFGIHTMDRQLVYNTPTIKIRGERYNRVYLSDPVRNFVSKADTQSYNHIILTIEVTDILTITHIDFPRTKKYPKERCTIYYRKHIDKHDKILYNNITDRETMVVRDSYPCL